MAGNLVINFVEIDWHYGDMGHVAGSANYHRPTAALGLSLVNSQVSPNLFIHSPDPATVTSLFIFSFFYYGWLRMRKEAKKGWGHNSSDPQEEGNEEEWL